jgi:O-antigen/teichoic acid export membrane protein
MGLTLRIQRLIADPVRLVQLFVLCRHSGVILSSVVIARILPLEEIGLFEMLMLSGYLVTFFWSDALLKGYLASQDEKPDKTSASAFLWLYLLVGLMTMTILVLGQKTILPVLVGRTSLEGLQLFAIYQALIIPVWISPFLGLLKGQNSILLSFYVLIGPSFSCWAGLQSMSDINGVIIGLLSYAFVGFIWVLTNTKFVRDLQLKKLILGIWPAAWPLMLYAVSAGIARSFDAWLVARHFDESTFAVFRYGAREFPVVLAFAAGLSTIMIPKLKSAEALVELKIRSVRLMHLCFPVVALVMFFSPILFEFVFGLAFRESAIIFMVYLLLTLTQLVFPQSVLTARGDTRLLWYISLAELVVNIAASLILLSYFGLVGIAFGTLIAFIFEKVVLLFFIKKRYGITVNQIIDPSIWALYSMILALTFIVSKWIFGV